MAPRSFARAYVEKLGRTPARMVEAMRFEAACRALEESGLPLKSIADAVGYGGEQKMRAHSAGTSESARPNIDSGSHPAHAITKLFPLKRIPPEHCRCEGLARLCITSKLTAN